MRTHIGRLLMGTGGLHTLIGVIGFRRTLVEIHRGRYLNTIGRDPERNAALWCLTTGALLVVLGQFARSTQERTGEVPRSLGWGLLAISVPGVVLVPASGFWLVLGQALLVLTPVRRKPAARESAEPGVGEGGLWAMRPSATGESR